MYGDPDALSDSERMAIHFFVNFDISNWFVFLTIASIYTKLGDFVILDLHFMTMWVNSCYSHNLQTRA